MVIYLVTNYRLGVTHHWKMSNVSNYLDVIKTFYMIMIVTLTLCFMMFIFARLTNETTDYCIRHCERYKVFRNHKTYLVRFLI